MPKIFVSRRIPEAGLERLRALGQVEVAPQDAPISPEALKQGAARADALVCMLTDRIDGPLLAACPLLKIVANYAVGTNNIDLLAASEKKVLVTNTPDVLSEATADLAWGLLLDAARGITSGDQALRRGEFKGWGPLYRLGTEVSGKTLGILGMGRIGQAVAERAKGFRMKVVYHQRHALEGADADFVSFAELLQQSDFLSLHCPLTPQTRHLLSREALSQMKPGAILINTARGEVVDEEALAQALADGKLAAAGLDVYEREPQVNPKLLDLPQVVLAPHLGSATRETRDAMLSGYRRIFDLLWKARNPKI